MVNREAAFKAAELMKERNLDALLIVPSQDLVFLAGESPWLCERFQGLFLKKNGEMFYIVNLLSEGEIRSMLGEEMKIYTWWDGEDFTDAVCRALDGEGLSGARIGVNMAARAANILSIAEKMPVHFTDARDLLNEVRIHKTSEELKLMRKSAQIADRAIEAVWKVVKPGMTEREVQTILCGYMEEYGGKDAEAIVSFGANASYPHYMVSGEGAILREKDVLLMDFGCSYQGFYSDMTRTVFIGEPTEEEKKIYETVLAANFAGEAAVLEGAYIPDVDKAARNVIEGAGYGQYFTTRLGHGIGYQVHESPEIKQSNRRNLEKGMAFSIEPGIYIPRVIGVRIEDIVVINESGEREVLNKVPKEMKVL